MLTEDMETWLLGFLPQTLSKYEWAVQLLKWAQEELHKFKNHGSTINYPIINDELIAAIEKSGSDTQSRKMLELVTVLRKHNRSLEKINKSESDAEIVDFALSDEYEKLVKCTLKDINNLKIGARLKVCIFAVMLIITMIIIFVGACERYLL